MFTNREQEIIDLLILGFNNKEIAEKLKITTHTAKAHVSSIYHKLNVSGRVQAVVKYLEILHLQNNDAV